ncbi:Ribosomal RNA large subunit methyltransferase A [Leminorella richardii]|uniref:Ribosomal RNA large subunit methyltransferase A n=1 Tax=Leminorella richardii TaxID=158841 RepID=A0A2X4V2D2_9GAMM|nr:23S rRNA (guanine(745)-N(1))-methyltransferase [Leminorella richardii]SQI41012.1 Ribosomal RNA large subunit methyltransferase A [Leminorella richardii]
MHYQCPLCRLPLRLNGRVWLCENRHQFDCAKEGYVNLMPVQHKKSKLPGDNAMMMQARRRFLDSGHYQPLREAAMRQLDEALPKEGSISLLDIGCGEGYYTHFIAEALSAHREMSVYGLDISKEAIRAAAKRYRGIHFSVASSYRLPFTDGDIDGVLRIYAPCNDEELQRTVKEQGIIVTAVPAPRHLFQLKEVIYREAKPHDDVQEEINGFDFVSQQRIHYFMTLTGVDAADLLLMTPFAWRASEALIADLKSKVVFECEADFYIRLYRKA